MSCLPKEEDELLFAREEEDEGVEDKRKARMSNLEVQTGREEGPGKGKEDVL